MYDPARDIFTENQPSSSPPVESYDLSALVTLAGLAAEAEIAPLPEKQAKAQGEPIKDKVKKEQVVQQVDVRENGVVETAQKEQVDTKKITENFVARDE